MVSFSNKLHSLTCVFFCKTAWHTTTYWIIQIFSWSSVSIYTKSLVSICQENRSVVFQSTLTHSLVEMLIMFGDQPWGWMASKWGNILMWLTRILPWPSYSFGQIYICILRSIKQILFVCVFLHNAGYLFWKHIKYILPVQSIQMIMEPISAWSPM